MEPQYVSLNNHQYQVELAFRLLQDSGMACASSTASSVLKALRFVFFDTLGPKV